MNSLYTKYNSNCQNNTIEKMEPSTYNGLLWGG